MKTFISTLLFAIMGLCMFGMYPMLRLLQLHTREIVAQELEKTIPDSQLEKFTDIGSDNNFSWERNGKEFEYKNNMYDVVKVVNSPSGSKTYYCYSDKQESKINKSIEALVSKQLDNGKTSTGAAAQYLLKLLAQTFIPVYPYALPHTAEKTANAAFCNASAGNYTAWFLKITTPPPQMRS